MSYLVLKHKTSIEFIYFGGPGYNLTVSAEKFNVPLCVRTQQNKQNGTFSVNQVIDNLRNDNVFVLTNSGANIYAADGTLLPQGVSVMEMEQKCTVGDMTMWLIDKEQKDTVECDFQMEYEADYDDDDDEDDWFAPVVNNEDDGFDDYEDVWLDLDQSDDVVVKYDEAIHGDIPEAMIEESKSDADS